MVLILPHFPVLCKLITLYMPHTIKASEYARVHNIRLGSHTRLRWQLISAPQKTFSRNMIGNMLRAPMKANRTFGGALLNTTMQFLLPPHSAVWGCMALDFTFSTARMRCCKQSHVSFRAQHHRSAERDIHKSRYRILSCGSEK